jgi:hypothetical protein
VEVGCWRRVEEIPVVFVDAEKGKRVETRKRSEVAEVEEGKQRGAKLEVRRDRKMKMLEPSCSRLLIIA